MSSEGRLQVLSAVTKKREPYKASDITEATGMDRQLVYYHLNKLIDAGLIKKMGNWYITIDLDTMVDQLVSAGEESKRQKSKPSTDTALVQIVAAARVAELAIKGKRIGVPMADSIVSELLFDIDKSLEFLKQLKRYINNYEPTVDAAMKSFKYEKSINLMLQSIAWLSIKPTMDEEQFEKTVSKIVEDHFNG